MADQKKNWLGCFAAPWAVLNDAQLLQSLSDRDFVCGFSEAVKVAFAGTVSQYQSLSAVGVMLAEMIELGMDLESDLGIDSIKRVEILSALARAPGRVFTRDMLLSRIWGDSAYRDPRTIDVHIKNLRHKLGGAGRHSRFVETVHGVGYRFAT